MVEVVLLLTVCLYTFTPSHMHGKLVLTHYSLCGEP